MSSHSLLGEDHVGIVNLDDTMTRTPRGRRGRHVRKECAAKARNHSRVASALPHSEDIAYKPPCGEIAMCPRVGGWGRLSDDGSRQHNSGKSEDPRGSGDSTSWRRTIESASRHSAGQPLDHEVHEGWMQTGCHGGYVGSRLKRAWHPGRHHPKCQPSSRIGENPPYGSASS